MKIKIDDELKKIFQQILDEHKTVEEWALIESDDYFQEPHYVGGFDATEKAFCFSYFNPQKEEYWFQLSLEKIKKIMLNEIDTLSIKSN